MDSQDPEREIKEIITVPLKTGHISGVPVRNRAGENMGNALVIIKIYPEEIEDSVKIEESVKGISNGEIKEVKREPIAFGLELVKIAVVIPDKEDGALPKLEEEIRALPGVKNIEIEGMTLL